MVSVTHARTSAEGFGLKESHVVDNKQTTLVTNRQSCVIQLTLAVSCNHSLDDEWMDGWMALVAVALFCCY